MKIYRCKEELLLPWRDRNGKKQDLPPNCVTVGMVFTADDNHSEQVLLKGLRGVRLCVSRQTLEMHFEELT